MSRFSLVAIVLAGSLWLSAEGAHAQSGRAVELRRAEGDYVTLRTKLDSLNAEIATLKSSRRSVRDDYRLRDRQAEAESTAVEVTQVEAKIRALGGQVAGDKTARTPVETPRATGEENRFESEAKADLLADQSARLLLEADRLSKASAELRGRQAMRKQAGKWDRDPFAGMESSKRNLPISASARGVFASDSTGSGTRGTNGAPTLGTNPGTGVTAETTTKSSGGILPPSGSTTISSGPVTNTVLSPPTASAPVVADSAASATGAKVSPTPLVSSPSERLEQRIFLDPATSAQLRNTLGSDAALSDPDALARASELLRARARALAKEEQLLRGRGR